MIPRSGTITVRRGRQLSEYEVEVADATPMKEIWKISRPGEQYMLSNNRPVLERHYTTIEGLVWRNERTGGCRSAFMQALIAGMEEFIKAQL